MNVLVLCEFSGEVRNAFAAQGHYAVSCDLLPSETDGVHFQLDARDILKWDFTWHLILAFPPCRYVANSGVRWLYNADGSKNAERWQEMEKAAKFFKFLLNIKCERLAIENPIQHKYAKEIIQTPYSQIIQPYQFGHGETKATCLWLKGLPKLQPTKIVEGRAARVHREPPGPDRWKNRSRTLRGIAEAMAEQFGKEGAEFSKS